MTDDVSDDHPAHHAHANIDIGFDFGRRIHNQSAFLREHFAGHVAVDAQQVPEAELAVEFRFARAVARTLLNRERAGGSSQLAGEGSFDRNRPAISHFAGDYGNARLKTRRFPRLSGRWYRMEFGPRRRGSRYESRPSWAERRDALRGNQFGCARFLLQNRLGSRHRVSPRKPSGAFHADSNFSLWEAAAKSSAERA